MAIPISHIDMAILSKHETGVLLLSGGLDSAVCLSVAERECKQVVGLFLSYGQKTLERERACVKDLAAFYRLKMLKEVDIGFLGGLTGAALCRSDSQVTGGNEYVPFRNGLFLSIATALAESVRARIIYIGSTGGDQICRDNSKEFRADFERVIMSGTNAGEQVRIAAPLEDVNKVGVVQRGVELGTPFELTWSCHNNTDVPCNVCSNCQARQAAFHALGLSDPVNA